MEEIAIFETVFFILNKFFFVTKNNFAFKIKPLLEGIIVYKKI